MGGKSHVMGNWHDTGSDVVVGYGCVVHHGGPDPYSARNCHHNVSGEFYYRTATLVGARLIGNSKLILPLILLWQKAYRLCPK